MNYVTQDIMKRFDLTADAALQVQDYMYNTELDFSECTKAEYDWCMGYCYDAWRKAALQNFNPFVEA